MNIIPYPGTDYDVHIEWSQSIVNWVDNRAIRIMKIGRYARDPIISQQTPKASNEITYST